VYIDSQGKYDLNSKGNGAKVTQKNIPTISFARGGNNVAQGNVP
jgi:hypothetical protein